ncbi:MAG: N-acetylmuramic acid 6-phosphate etherase [Proteobacteria bacterium]|nr:N-acetylmuramic acid 6-phosphate etherase [Pseudomonadota bacterium]
MTAAATENLHPAARGLDLLEDVAILGHILDGQIAALSAIPPALADIARAASLMAETIRGGGTLIYAGAGSSALMAVADGLELHGTFGIAPDRIRLLMAGGLPRDARMPGETEDDATAGARDAAGIGAGDLVIAVAASGRTPYPIAVAEAARARGAKVVAIANNPGAPLFDKADVAIALATPAEIVAGSTRMGAGTAQKAALNMISTLAGIRLGQVHDGRMVGLVADNAKLKVRAAGVVADIAGVAPDAAAKALAAAKGAVKPAILIARGADAAQATALLHAHNGILRAALAQWEASSRTPSGEKSQQLGD